MFTGYYNWRARSCIMNVQHGWLFIYKAAVAALVAVVPASARLRLVNEDGSVCPEGRAGKANEPTECAAEQQTERLLVAENLLSVTHTHSHTHITHTHVPESSE